ncbi:Vacuolar protein-sorting-associated protein 36, partial [Fragariocoptes setiger]
MAGIVRIEQKIRSKQEDADKSISLAFQDLKQLMGMAQQMATLSKQIAQKMKEHGAQVTTDETLQLKSHLLELGVSQPEFENSFKSKSSYSNADKYYIDLARQIACIAKPVMKNHKKSQMTLPDVYCCFNRARGVDLVSPEDVLNACQIYQDMPELGMRLVKYTSGLLVLESVDLDGASTHEQTLEFVRTKRFTTPPQMALQLSIPVSLARQRLQECENLGLLCRDESIEGLAFYPNMFLNQDITSK